MSWEQVLSSEVLDIRDGTHDSPKYKDSGYPLITSKNLKNGVIDFNDVSLISEDDYLAINKRSKVDKGDILYSMIGSVGNYALVEKEPDFAIKNVALFKFIDDRLYNKYFLHLINSSVINRQIERTMKGGTQKFVSLKILRNLRIPLPPLDQQKKIAAILDAADAYRQKTKALIAKYDELTQSLFLDMFGDPVTNPKGWDVHHLGELVENKDSKRIPIKSSDRDNMIGKFPYYGASRIIDYVDDFTHQGQNLLIGEDGANLLARSTPIAFIADGQYWVNNHAHVLGFNGKSLLVYLEFFINAIDLKPYVSGSAQPKLNRKNMDKITVSCPPMKLQNQFKERVQAIKAQKEQAQESLDKAEELFNSLLQRAFKGELV